MMNRKFIEIKLKKGRVSCKIEGNPALLRDFTLELLGKDERFTQILLMAVDLSNTNIPKDIEKTMCQSDGMFSVYQQDDRLNVQIEGTTVALAVTLATIFKETDNDIKKGFVSAIEKHYNKPLGAAIKSYREKEMKSSAGDLNSLKKAMKTTPTNEKQFINIASGFSDEDEDEDIKDENGNVKPDFLNFLSDLVSGKIDTDDDDE